MGSRSPATSLESGDDLTKTYHTLLSLFVYHGRRKLGFLFEKKSPHCDGGDLYEHLKTGVKIRKGGHPQNQSQGSGRLLALPWLYADTRTHLLGGAKSFFIRFVYYPGKEKASLGKGGHNYRRQLMGHNMLLLHFLQVLCII